MIVEMDLRSWLFLYLSSISTPFIHFFFILYVHSSIQKPEDGPPKQYNDVCCCFILMKFFSGLLKKILSRLMLILSKLIRVLFFILFLSNTAPILERPERSLAGGGAVNVIEKKLK
ncbi:hypothetical protein Hanom_Chr12g01124321 [Helianthus anomalus]